MSIIVWRTRTWLLLALAATACTSNPLGDNEISKRPRTISGQIKLGNGDPPEGAYIWLEAFDIGSRADRDGRFSMILPPVSISTRRVDGVFNLHFFVENYTSDVQPVAVRGGELIPAQDGLRDGTEIARKIVLFRRLSVLTEIEQSPFSENKTIFSLNFTVTLYAHRGPVRVDFPFNATDATAPAILRHLETGQVSVVTARVVGLAEPRPLVDTDVHIRRMSVTLQYADFPAGRYEAIPYLLVSHPAVPRQLVRSIAPEVTIPGADYLKLPFVRDGGMFHLLEHDVDN